MVVSFPCKLSCYFMRSANRTLQPLHLGKMVARVCMSNIFDQIPFFKYECCDNILVMTIDNFTKYSHRFLVIISNVNVMIKWENAIEQLDLFHKLRK